VKDLVKAMSGRLGTLSGDDIVAICHKPWFIPETTSLHDQLLAFRSRRQHFALVVDEYGSWQGIVTLEDIIEEIVGNIDDEHDETSRDIQKISDQSYLISGSVTLRDLKRQLDWDLPDEHASTIAGLLIHEAQTIPSVGEHYFLHGFRFTVVEKDDTQLSTLRIEKLVGSEPVDDVEL
jgi:Mg2+/Co2+ transporter CorB